MNKFHLQISTLRREILYAIDIYLKALSSSLDPFQHLKNLEPDDARSSSLAQHHSVSQLLIHQKKKEKKKKKVRESHTMLVKREKKKAWREEDRTHSSLLFRIIWTRVLLALLLARTVLAVLLRGMRLLCDFLAVGVARAMGGGGFGVAASGDEGCMDAHC